MTYKIDKAVPVPDTRFGSGKSKYPFDKMEVGDSFYAPIKQVTAISATRHRTLYWPGEKYTTSKEGDGVRVFRIA